MFRYLLLFFLLQISGYNTQAQYFDTVQLHYEIGSFQLSNGDKQVLDSVIANFGDRRILIYGHADYLGTENPNLLLSEQRAKAVLQYLVSKGFPEIQVMQCVGSGQIKTKKAGVEGNPESRITEIFIIKQKPTKEKKQVVKMIAQNPAPTKSAPANVTKFDYNSIKVGDTIKLENISFYPGEQRILPSSYAEVDNLIEMLKLHPGLKISLEGHVCCCIYPDGYFPDTPHWILSVRRAKEVRAVLIKHGIAADRLAYKGFGRTHPILDQEETSEQGQVNRRVEIRILAK